LLMRILAMLLGSVALTGAFMLCKLTIELMLDAYPLSFSFYYHYYWLIRVGTLGQDISWHLCWWLLVSWQSKSGS